MKKIALFLILSLGALPGYALEVSDPAPEFDLLILGSNASIQLSELKGKVIFIDFWASWCGPCLISMPEYARWHESLPEDAVMLGINIDKQAKRAVRFLRRNPMPFPILQDPGGEVAASYQLPGMPSSFVIDREGHIAYIHSGFRPGDMEKIRAAFNQVYDQ